MDLFTIAAAIASAGLKRSAQRGVEKKQQQIAEQMRQYKLGRAAEQEAATRGYMDTITPEARAAQMQRNQGDVRQSIEQTVAEAVKAPPLDTGGRPSDGFSQARETGRAANAEAIKRAIEQLAIGASTERMATDDDLRLRRAATELGAAGTASRNVGDQYMAAIQTVRPNSAKALLGDLTGALATMGFAQGARGGVPRPPAGTPAPGATGTGGLGLKMPTRPAGLRL